MESISLSDDGEEDVNSKDSPRDLAVNVCMESNTKGENMNDALENNDNVQEMPSDAETNKSCNSAVISFDDVTDKNATEYQDSCSAIKLDEPEQEESKMSKVIDVRNSSSGLLNGENSLPVQSVAPSIPTTVLLDDNHDLNVQQEYCVQENPIDVSEPMSNVTPERIRNIEGQNDRDFVLNQDKMVHSTNVSENKLECNSDDKEKSKVLCEESESDSLRLTNRILRLEEDRGKLTTEVMEKEILALKLEKETNYLRTEVSQLEAQHTATLSEIEKKHKQNMDQMAVKMSELKKHFINANREKESMVMKYALREKDIIVEKATREDSDKKCRAAQKEKEDAVTKMKNSIADKTKFQHLSDSRMQEISCLKKEVERWKEEVKIQEGKSATSAGRLKEEVDAHRVTRENMDAAIKHLSETRAEIDKTRKECTDFMDKFRNDEDGKLRKEKEAKQEQSAKLIIDEAAATELVAVREKYNKLTEENSVLNEKIQTIEKSRQEQEKTLHESNLTLNSQKEQIDGLLKQVAGLEGCKMKLSLEEKTSADQISEIETLREELVELSTDMKSCKEKEARLLEFTEKLTETNVSLQANLSAAECRVSALNDEHNAVMTRAEEAESFLSILKSDLKVEKTSKKQETELLARKLAEKSNLAELLSQQTLDAKNEVQVLKKKHASSLRELTRELQIAHSASTKHQKGFTNAGIENNNHQLPISSADPQDSRTSSNSSLNRLGSQPNEQGNVESEKMNFEQKSSTNTILDSPISTSSSQSNMSYDNSSQKNVGDEYSNPSFVFSGVEESDRIGKVPESHILVDKIVKLQRTLARKQEKIEFMEEHVSTMLKEMQKKNKLIQNYIIKVEPGALVSTQMDENKRKVSEHGGIMASIYSSNRDSGLTIELSLEINRKLQAVLEDTLLKNIMLKENINTLGNEIATMAGGKHKTKP